MFRAVLILFGLGCFAFFGYLTFDLHSRASEHEEKAQLVARDQVFSEDEAFVAVATVDGGAEGLLKGPVSQDSCAAYIHSVYVRFYDPDDDSSSKSSIKIFEVRDQVADLSLSFEARQMKLDLNLLPELSQANSTEESYRPSYVRADQVPEEVPLLRSYLVRESLLVQGQQVVVGARLDSEGQLGAHPGLGELLFYMGSREECVQHYQDKANATQNTALKFLFMGLFLSSLPFLGLRFV